MVKDGGTARNLLLYSNSIDFLLKEYSNEKDPLKQQPIAFQLGDSYKQFNDYANAEKWFKQSLDLNGGEKSLLELAFAQKQQEKYELAYKNFERYQQISGTAFTGKQQANQCRDAIEWKKSFTKIQVRNLDALNTPDNDYGLEFYKSYQFTLTSSRDEALGTLRDGWTGQKCSDIFSVEKKDNNFSVVQNFGTPVNSNFQESSPTYSKDFKEMYFVRCAQSDKNNEYCHVYYSAFNNEKWSEPVNLGLFADTINVYDPYLSRDGKFLLVSADAPDNFGKTDLYILMKADSGWGEPQNLGGAINTPASERFPWIDEKGNLFFSSGGLPGMGGLDIFKSTKTKAGYKDPQNLRYPINSGADDFGFRIDKYKPANSEDTILYSGYFSSNRTGGKGGDDIYRFEEKWINYFLLKGIAYEAVYENPDNADSKIIGRKELKGAKIELKKTDETVVASAVSDSTGNFKFQLEPKTAYKILGSKNGYLSNSNSIAPLLPHQDSTLIITYAEVTLNKIFPQKLISIPNIYYDYDRATLRHESKIVLDSILIFFKENPDLTIEIGSHTDSRGSDTYNIKLSQARAQSVVDYLIEKGIAAEKLKAKGYGETSPVNNCTNGAKCSEDEFQKNRRTTFRVISAKLNLESVEPNDIRVDPKKD